VNELAGKKALILGVANERSIAWGIARELSQAGAHVILSYQNENLLKRVAPLAQEIGAELFLCDVLNSENLKALFAQLGELDILVHSIAYANTQSLSRPLHEVLRADFNLAFESSVFSLIELSHEAALLMKKGGSILTLSYIGADRVVPGYGLMGPVKAALECSVRYLAHELGPLGIRVNAISAGPLRTLSSAAFGQIKQAIKEVETHAPLRQNISTKDIGNLAVFLSSDKATMISGETIFVDSGLHIMS